MTKTKQDYITELQTEYPTLTKASNDEVIELSSAQYDATIDAWAQDRVRMQAEKEAEKNAATAKAAALAKLVALGLTTDDLKALGL